MQTDVVIGPPGCGKTTWLARQVELAVAAGERPAVMSLTKSAALEVRQRELPLPKEAVGTLHSHAYRALDRPEIAESAKHLKEWNLRHPHFALPIQTRSVDEDNADTIGDTLGAQAMALWQISRARMQPAPNKVRPFVQAWRKWTRENELVDFTGLIEQSIEMTHWTPGRPTALFVDEAQDLSQLELTLIRRWASDADRLVLVGDPWQNLYEWRGTDASAFAVSDGGVERVLGKSYRVPRAVHSLATSWIREMHGWREIEYEPTDEPGEVTRSGCHWKYPEPLLRAVERDIDDGKTVMLLASCSYMLGPVVGALRQRGIPYHNPYRRTTAPQWNPLAARRGVSAVDRVLAFLRPTTSYSMTWEEGDVEAWTRAVNAKSAIRSGRRKDAADLHDDLTAAENALTREAMDAVWSGDLDWLERHALSARKQSLKYPIRVAKRLGADALRQEPKLVVGTVNSVKGGEADSVYIYPDLSGSGNKLWRWADDTNRAGIYRLFYVAMTRAKQKLTLCAPASGYAVDIPNVV